MEINIMIEPAFENSSWCNAIFDGLIKALSKKRTQFAIVTEVPTTSKTDNSSFLILISSSEKWLATAISICRDRKIHPIVLGSQPHQHMPGAYSSVTSNIRQSMSYLITYLKKHNKVKPALYGINPASLQDIARKDSFLSFLGTENEQDVYYNNGSLENCFDEFKDNYSKYDCVICANDYSAISLIKYLEMHNISLQNLLPVSYGGTLLASRYADKLLTISMSYEEYGKAALSICETISKNPALLYLNIAVKWKIVASDKQISEDLLFDEKPSSPNPSNSLEDNLFYSDNQMQDMILTENMLSFCDKTDFTIISMLLDGSSYEQIAEDCFISVNTVKYRLKKLMDIVGAKNKKEFTTFLEKYYQ